LFLTKQDAFFCPNV